jgi:putative transposase
MMVTRCYRYRLHPTSPQIETLVRWAGCRRWAWNWALRRKQTYYAAMGKSLTYHVLAGELVDLKRQSDTLWLKECHSQVLQQALMDLEAAFVNFFEKRAKYPRFKSRKRTPHSLRFPQNVTIVDDRTVSIPKIGLVRAIVHRPLVGVAKSATVKQDATGAWWVVFVCHIERPDVAPACINPVGIDMGLESFTTLHTGHKVAPPKFYRRGEKKLKRLARKLSRTQKGSNNRQKARKRLARAHQRIRNQRTDWLHKQARELIRHYDTVCIEDLNVRGLARTKLAKSFTDAAVSTFVQLLGQKAEWHGGRVVKVGRFYASSKTCHHCQHKTTLMLSDRVWTCRTCSTTHDRDINAAINILHEGLRIVAAGMSETQNAAGDAVRPAIVGEHR